VVFAVPALILPAQVVRAGPEEAGRGEEEREEAGRGEAGEEKDSDHDSGTESVEERAGLLWAGRLGQRVGSA
jgi:hypothetical protein